jgi:hypothetical protein
MSSNGIQEPISMGYVNLVEAEAYFDNTLISLHVGRISWELRAASMARLWRDQDKRDEARELLAPRQARSEGGEGWLEELGA